MIDSILSNLARKRGNDARLGASGIGDAAIPCRRGRKALRPSSRDGHVRRAAAVHPPGYDGLPGGAQGLRALRIDYDQDKAWGGAASTISSPSRLPGSSRIPAASSS